MGQIVAFFKTYWIAFVVLGLFTANVLNAVTHQWPYYKGVKKWALFLVEVFSFSSSRPKSTCGKDIFADAKDPSEKVQP